MMTPFSLLLFIIRNLAAFASVGAAFWLTVNGYNFWIATMFLMFGALVTRNGLVFRHDIRTYMHPSQFAELIEQTMLRHKLTKEEPKQDEDQ